MQVFVPYAQPLMCAMCLDKKRLRKQIIECHQILNAIEEGSGAWFNHPVVKMYAPEYTWLHDYTLALEYYAVGNMGMAEWWSQCADGCRPDFLTAALCDQHKRRLYTKAPDLYPWFVAYGKSEENWYVVNGEILKYINGKQV